jgi:hypothetical protein
MGFMGPRDFAHRLSTAQWEVEKNPSTGLSVVIESTVLDFSVEVSRYDVGMKKRVRSGPRLLVCLLISLAASDLGGANMRSFIEAVRRKAPVVYVGSVKEVRFLERTKFDIKARAVITASSIARGPDSGGTEAVLDYSSYDDKTPMLAGGPQFQLRPGTMVVVFTESFRSSIPTGYLLHGSRQELLERVKALREKLSQMSGEELKRNEVDEADRQVQLALYEKLLAHLGPHP